MTRVVVDGSRSSSGAAAGWGWYAEDSQFGLGPCNPEHECEVDAIRAAILVHPRMATVYTDSRAAYDRLVTRLYLDRDLVRGEEWRAARRLLDRTRTTLVYLPPAVRDRSARSFHPASDNRYDPDLASWHAAAHLLANAARLRLPLTRAQLTELTGRVITAANPSIKAHAVVRSWTTIPRGAP